MFSCILFDLDGTISDPKQGICGCVQYALRSFGIEEPELDRLEPFIGPPLAESFMKYYNFTAEQAQEAVEKYRERFSVTGKYENVLYPGMGALLHDLKASGATLAIASSKPTVYVEDILVHFGIREYFDIVVGSELDGRRVHKEEVVAEVLSQLAARGESDRCTLHRGVIWVCTAGRAGKCRCGDHCPGCGRTAKRTAGRHAGRKQRAGRKWHADRK